MSCNPVLYTLDPRDTHFRVALRSSVLNKVNGRRLEPYTPQILVSGDQMEMGDVVLIFELS